MIGKKICIIIIVIGLGNCTPTNKISRTGNKQIISISKLQFLDEYDIPFDLKYKDTWVGGLSGIDYDTKNNNYYIISDERSASSPSRFYKAAIKINNYKIDTIIFNDVQFIKLPSGDTFPSLKTNAINAADPESIRYNRVLKNLIWTSEGDRAVRNGEAIIKDPWIWEMDVLGNYKDSFALPLNMHMQANEKGPRLNSVFEGTSFDEKFQYLYVSVEEPLYEDGPRADINYAGAPIRIIKYNVKTRKPVAQYAYPLDAIAKEPVPATGYKGNGISEILWSSENKLLIIERSFSTGTQCVIKIFEADMDNATDVSNITALHQNKNYKRVQKKLLFNFESLNRYIDNVEGVTFGPLLPNGHRSLLFTVDNNFNKAEKEQLFLFEIIP